MLLICVTIITNKGGDYMKTVRVVFYGNCFVVHRETVLHDLQYQYEGTEDGYDIYSNDDGDYFAVKEDED